MGDLQNKYTNNHCSEMLKGADYDGSDGYYLDNPDGLVVLQPPFFRPIYS